MSTDLHDWEYWTSPDLNVIVPVGHPDYAWLTRTLALKHRIENVTEEYAHKFFDRAQELWVHKKKPVDKPTEDDVEDDS